MLILTHLAAFLAGVVAIILLARYVDARERAARSHVGLLRRRLAIRRPNADSLPAHSDDDDDLSDRLVAELNAIVNQE